MGGDQASAEQTTQASNTGPLVRNPAIPEPFTDTRFLESSSTGNWASRLNWRHDVLLARNRHFVEGKRILDIASHDGRFSWAALQMGAKHVTGVEGRPELVAASKENLAALQIPTSRFEFRCNDIFEEMAAFRPGDFDTIFCFGFFYHTIRHVELVRHIQRLAPKTMILDTNVYVDPVDDERPMVVLRNENSTEQHATVDPINLVGWTNRRYTTAVFESHGFGMKEINWRELGITQWGGLEDYEAGWRASYLAENKLGFA